MRADLFLVTHNYARSREAARKAVEAGLVSIDGKRISKPSEQIDENNVSRVDFVPPERYVSRGGVKLEYALNTFGIDVTGLDCVDIGASTGGFTDCLLAHGAARVYAVDSGHGQLAQCLRDNPRVVSLEGLNARSLSADDIGQLCDIAVMDVSFISQTLIHPRIRALLKDDGSFVSLIKPQFEVGRGGVGKHGIVRDTSLRRSAVMNVVGSASANGLYLKELCRSPVTGGDGNTEYLAYFTLKETGTDINPIDSVDY